MYPFDLMDIYGNLQLLKLLPQLLVADSLLGLILKRSDLIFQLADEVMNTKQILLCFIQLAAGVFLA
ncbi:hypothetical protein D3C81_2174530 [compost metagenome]